MKDRNKIIRAKLSDDEKVARLVKLGMEEQDARALLVPDFCGRVGYPAYKLANNNATLRTAKKRLESVRQLKSQERKEYDVNGVRVVENPQENRFQIFFSENRQMIFAGNYAMPATVTHMRTAVGSVT